MSNTSGFQTALADSSSDIDHAVEGLSVQVNELRAQLRHAQKLASLGTASAMLAHEYNNAFAPVVSYAQYALDTDDAQLMRKSLTWVLKQFDAVREMSDRVLGLARQESQSTGAVELRKVVEDSLACLGRDLSKDRVTVVIDVDESLRVRGNHNQLQQVLFNLVLNARQAMLGRQGRLRITAQPPTDGNVQIQVSDNGRGIDPRNLDRIFDPFFTTKQDESTRDRRGVGLGLAVCKDIIEDHGGQIDVHSAERQGTTFNVTLPLSSACSPRHAN